jgi:hypothetical protein
MTIEEKVRCYFASRAFRDIGEPRGKNGIWSIVVGNGGRRFEQHIYCSDVREWAEGRVLCAPPLFRETT